MKIQPVDPGRPGGRPQEGAGSLSLAWMLATKLKNVQAITSPASAISTAYTSAL